MRDAADSWSRIGEIFSAARELAPGRRIAFLDETCRDPDMRLQVEALLRADTALESDASDGFLEAIDDRLVAALLAPEATRSDPNPVVGDVVERYRIERRLGAGGMGVVYLARDTRLDRPVALKVLARHLAFDAGARRRFAREARAASALDHPGIAAIYEISAPDERLFIAMAYCEGETLRDELRRGPLRPARAISIATQVADGLAAAHRAGIVHRDIKPGNIIVSPDGIAKIVDFGIARMVGTDITKMAGAHGTAAYMSPEQTRADAADPRSDVWSLGVTLYEMIAGHRPFDAQGEQALIFAIRNDPPVTLAAARPGAPVGLCRIVDRCLRKDPAERYADAGALLSDLRRLEGDLSWTPADPAVRWRRAGRYALLAASLAVTLLLGHRPPAGSVRGDSGDAAVLDVLPIEGTDTDPEFAYLPGALTGEIASRLSRVAGIAVVTRVPDLPEGSVRSVGDVDGQHAAHRFLAGDLRTEGDRLRLQIRLHERDGATALWSHEYSGTVSRLTLLLRTVLRDVIDALDVAGTDGAVRALYAGTESEQAYEHYIRGRYYLGRLDRESFRMAAAAFDSALARDPLFARARAGLAISYVQRASVAELSARDAFPRVRDHAERALEVDSFLADAHASLATALTSYFWRSDSAELHFERAIALDPGHAPTYRLYSRHLRNMGRFADALEMTREAEKLEPNTTYPYVEEAIVLYLAGCYDDALDVVDRLLNAGGPGTGYANIHRAMSLAQLRRYDDAIAALDRIEPDSRNLHTTAIRGVVFAMAGDSAAARRILDGTAIDPDLRPGLFQRAAILTQLGEHDRALDVLAQAVKDHVPAARIMGVEPILDPLRDDPRFDRLLVDAGLTGDGGLPIRPRVDPAECAALASPS